MLEYMSKIGLGMCFDDLSINMVLTSFDTDNNKMIDKDEMLNLIVVVLFKKDELQKKCDDCHNKH